MSDSAPEKSDSRKSSYESSLRRYWNGNIKIMIVLLAIWALAGLGCGVLFAEKLNAYSIGGAPLGFWFAQQGSIIIFVLIILAFCIIMNKRDEKHHEEVKGEEGQGGEGI